jgi:HD-GYP domain-containing protein (c-di-GMP phosphodiesterase class II)
MERHPELGARILEHANLRDIAGWVLAHHERIDGAGYPRRIAGDEIPVEARILAVADAYEAMTADRPYRRALPAAVARGQLERGAGTQFDAGIVAAFVALLEAEDRVAAAGDASARGPRAPAAGDASARGPRAPAASIPR